MKHNRQCSFFFLLSVITSQLQTGCVKDLMDEYVHKPISNGVDSMFENVSSSPEQRQKVSALAVSMQARRPLTLGASGDKRLPFKEGQWVVYLTEQTRGGAQAFVEELIVTRVRGEKVTLERTVWDARDDAVAKTFALEFSGVPSPMDLILSQEWRDQAGDTLKLHRFAKIEDDGFVVQEEHSGSGDKKDLNQFAGMMLLGIIFPRYARDATSIEAGCVTEAVESTQCLSYKGYSRDIIGERYAEEAFVHSQVPIVGLVRAQLEKGTTKLIAFGTRGRPSRFKGRPIRKTKAGEVRVAEDLRHSKNKSNP